MVSTIQDRTNEFRTILAQTQKRQNQSRNLSQKQPFIPASSSSSTSNSNSNGNAQPPSTRSQFAREAAQIGRSITNTMTKLERLAQLARKRAIFDDRPLEINELTFIIKQDLARLNTQIQSLSQTTQQQHSSQPKPADQEGQHNKNVVLLLQNSIADVAANFKDTLEVRTKNIQASRSRTENFVSSVSSRSVASATGASLLPRSESPLYQPSQRAGHSAPKQPGSNNSQTDLLLTLDPPTSSSAPLLSHGHPSQTQLQLMEEAQPSYITQRSNAIEAIETTINELGSIFGQLAGMVAQQGEQIQRIDANTEDVLENVEGAQRELVKYWGRVQGSRWLVAKMMGVLMVFFLLWVLISG